MGLDQESLQNYIEYTNKVLGVRSIILSPESPREFTFDLHVRVQGLSTYSSQENELLQKMLAAMKLEHFSVHISEYEISQNIHSHLCLIFSDNPVQPDETYSARVLILQPEFKKKAWADLQTVVKNLSQIK